MIENKNSTLALCTVLPNGDGGYEPCPELLTEAETVRYLRLDTLALRNPSDTLRYYRNKKLLNATPISNHLFYTRKSLDEFLEKITQENAERS
ncbi:MAG: hypothetical protein ACYTBX_15010 [Planctomycetota bacterium]|jgi:hypothetical protein